MNYKQKQLLSKLNVMKQDLDYHFNSMQQITKNQNIRSMLTLTHREIDKSLSHFNEMVKAEIDKELELEKQKETK